MPGLTSSIRSYVVLLVFLGAGPVALQAAETRTVKVGMLVDNYPFSFRTADGKIEGFSRDIVREVSQVMALKLDPVEGSTVGINGAFTDGRLDMLQSFAHSVEREAVTEFSFPYLTMEGVIIVRANERGIATLADLRGKKVAVHHGSLGESLLQRAGLADSIYLVDSVEDAIRQLDAGHVDATLASRLTALAIAHHLNLKNVRALPTAVEGYEVRYCIAVRKGDHQLLARVNEGLAVLTRTGRFDEIYQRWFGAIEPTKYTGEQVALGVALGLALALAVALWAGMRQRALRLRIAKQAEELKQSEERHRAVFEGAQDGLIVLGPAKGPAGDHAIERMNPTARRLLKVSDDRAGGGDVAWVAARRPRAAWSRRRGGDGSGVWWKVKWNAAPAVGGECR